MDNLECFLGDINLHYRNSDYDKIKAENDLNRNCLSAWKNDTVYAKIVMKSENKKIENIKITPSDFTDESENIIDKNNIKTYFIRETKAYIGNGKKDDGSRESFPDVLEENSETSMNKNSILSVFLKSPFPKKPSAELTRAIFL